MAREFGHLYPFADGERATHRFEKAYQGDQVRTAFDRHSPSVLDVPFLLAAFLLRVALVLSALGVALLVCGPAVDLACARFLFGSLVCVPALLALLRLVGGQGSAR
jgi:hypothetical protein